MITPANQESFDELKNADVCVLVVSFDSGQHLPDFLDSLAPAAGDLTLRVVVVDNGSSDDSVAVARDRGAIVIPTGANLGYAGGINVGREWAQGCPMILIANPDLHFTPGSIATLHSTAMRHPGSIVVPVLRGPGNGVRLSLRREPTVLRQLGEALSGDHWPKRPRWFAIMVRDPAAYQHQTSTDWATGAALMIPADCDRRVGDWDESFFLYSEEVDFARRARSVGYQMWFTPDACATHEEGGSGRSDRLFSLDAVNRVRYFDKWHNRPHTVMYTAAILIELLLRIARHQHRQALGVVARTGARVALRRPLPSGAELMGITAQPASSSTVDSPLSKVFHVSDESVGRSNHPPANPYH